MNRKILRGDMYYANLNPTIGSEQGGFRPVLIVQNNIGNSFSTTLIIASISGQTKTKANLPTHCLIKAGNGIEKPSLILLEQLRTIDKSRLGEYIGSLAENKMKEVDSALAVSIGFELPFQRKRRSI